MAFIVVVSLTDNNKYPTGIGNKLLFGIEFLTVVLFYSTDVAGKATAVHFTCLRGVCLPPLWLLARINARTIYIRIIYAHAQYLRITMEDKDNSYYTG